MIHSCPSKAIIYFATVLYWIVWFSRLGFENNIVAHKLSVPQTLLFMHAYFLSKLLRLFLTKITNICCLIQLVLDVSKWIIAYFSTCITKLLRVFQFQQVSTSQVSSSVLWLASYVVIDLVLKNFLRKFGVELSTQLPLEHIHNHLPCPSMYKPNSSNLRTSMHGIAVCCSGRPHNGRSQSIH